MKEVFERQYTVGFGDTDLHGICRPSSLLGYFQDIATLHAADLGMGRDTLGRKYGAFWMMVRMVYRLNAPLLLEDTVTIRTWHRGAKTVMIFRDFDIIKDGIQVGEAITSWVICDGLDKRIIRPSSVTELGASPVPENTKAGRPGRIGMAEDMAKAYVYRVRYSDTDINGHMNNTRYGDVACDIVGKELAGGSFVSGLHVNYLLECRLGEDITLLKGWQGGRWTIKGSDKLGQERFEAALKLAPIAAGR